MQTLFTFGRIIQVSVQLRISCNAFRDISDHWEVCAKFKLMLAQFTFRNCRTWSKLVLWPLFKCSFSLRAKFNWSIIFVFWYIIVQQLKLICEFLVIIFSIKSFLLSCDLSCYCKSFVQNFSSDKVQIWL